MAPTSRLPVVSVVVTAGVEASTSAPVVNVPDGPNVVWPTWVVLPPSLDSTRWTYTRLTIEFCRRQWRDGLASYGARC